jgi:anti-sigma factor RsiW
MLTCTQVSELLFDYVENDLDDDTAARVGAHLDRCPACQGFVGEYVSVRGLVREGLELEVDAVLQSELEAAVLSAIAEADSKTA